MDRIDLPNVTLISIVWGDKKYLRLTNNAYKYFGDYFNFKSIKLLVPRSFLSFGKMVSSEIELIPCLDEEFSMGKYNEFCIKELVDFFDTDFVMMFQYDGFILNPINWNDMFLEFDYIGAPWWYNDTNNVGNGGFSIRSKRLHTILAKDSNILKMRSFDKSNEDHFICRICGDYLKNDHIIKFAPESVACKFSLEGDFYDPSCLGFHGEQAFNKFMEYQKGNLS